MTQMKKLRFIFSIEGIMLLIFIALGIIGYIIGIASPFIVIICGMGIACSLTIISEKSGALTKKPEKPCIVIIKIRE